MCLILSEFEGIGAARLKRIIVKTVEMQREYLGFVYTGRFVFYSVQFVFSSGGSCVETVTITVVHVCFACVLLAFCLCLNSSLSQIELYHQSSIIYKKR